MSLLFNSSSEASHHVCHQTICLYLSYLIPLILYISMLQGIYLAIAVFLALKDHIVFCYLIGPTL